MLDCLCTLCNTDFDSREGEMQICPNCYPVESAQERGENVTRKIGQNRGKSRLWIEGAALVQSGLDHGQRWILRTHAFGLTIERVPADYAETKFDGLRVRKIAGKTGRPIIDISGNVLDVFGDAESVNLALNDGIIYVTPFIS